VKPSKQSKEARPSSGGNHTQLLRELWEASVRLRGSIEPADYKRYVLPIIFLRFLSLRYERCRADIQALLDDSSSEYATEDPAARESILEDPDEYRARGAFIVPTQARWDSILQAARRDDFKSHLDDVLQAVEDAYPDKLRGLLPRIYAGSNLDVEDLRSLINIFSQDVFRQDLGGEDLIGKVYEYFIGEFASSEGKRGGEYFTPVSIVRTLVELLKPESGSVFDPCCGSGGMFVQSEIATRNSHQLSFYGQESKEFTYRLCRMNLFIHGLDGNIQLGSSYTADKHAELRADYILANPPFNDGSQSREGWGADKIPPKDQRRMLGGERMPLSPRNANTMWILHFLHHLSDSGTAGFVMSTGELTTVEQPRLQVRAKLVDENLVDCVVALSGKLFANTQIPCCLWLVSKDRLNESSRRRDKVLFIDARHLGSLIPGSRKQKELSSEEIARIASAYEAFRKGDEISEESGFCQIASIEQIKSNEYVLTPNLYTGNPGDEELEAIESVLPAIKSELLEHAARVTRNLTQLEAALKSTPELDQRPTGDRGLLQGLDYLSRLLFKPSLPT